MQDFLRHVFGWVCGQNPAHTWSPGGEQLPLCQRCTGVYAGALVAALLHLAWRPVPTPRWRWLHGAFLLFMLPSGYYWIPQPPELRCGSGILFGFGLVAFLWLTLRGFCSGSSRRQEAQTKVCNGQSTIGNQPEPPHVGCYQLIDKNSRAQMSVFTASLLAALVLVPVLAEDGNAVAAGILTAACLGGALALAALLLANLFLLLHWLAWRISAPAA